MDRTISATELAKNLSDILNRIRYRRESFVVERNGEPVASLGPIGAQRGISVRDLIVQLGDLTVPGDGFADDLEAIQAAQPAAEAPAWPT